MFLEQSDESAQKIVAVFLVVDAEREWGKVGDGDDFQRRHVLVQEYLRQDADAKPSARQGHGAQDIVAHVKIFRTFSAPQFDLKGGDFGGAGGGTVKDERVFLDLRQRDALFLRERVRAVAKTDQRCL